MCSSDPPDTSGTNEAARRNAEIAEKSLDFYVKSYNDGAPARAAAETRAQQVSDAQLKAMGTATDQAKETYDYSKSTFRPIEEKLAADAQTYDTAGRRTAAANAATADVDNAFSNTQAANDRALARAGVAPGSAKALALKNDASIAASATRAGAATTATRNVEQQGYARMADVANMGRNLASTQATQQSLANTSGNSSVANQMTGLAASQSGVAQMGQGFQTAIQGNQSAGNMFMNAANATYSANAANTATNNATLSGAAGLAGAFLLSDEDTKTDRKPASKTKMLKRVLDTDVETWAYDPESGGIPDGGVEHTGPMAQRVRQTMGEQAAPGGKVIDPISVQGNLIGGMQELARRVQQLEKKKAA